MPRPVKENPRDCFKTFRFTEDEIAQLEARARRAGRTLSDYVRIILLADREGAAASETTGRVAPVRSRDHAVQAVAEQMRKVGVNLNQIARRMNEQRIPPPKELTGILSDIRNIVREAREP